VSETWRVIASDLDGYMTIASVDVKCGWSPAAA
jgi:hypothetical protein